MYRNVTSTAIAIVVSSGLSLATASAADLGAATPAPIYTKAPLAVPFSWTGFYVGGNVGYGWGTAKNDPSFTQSDGTFSAGFDATDTDKVNGVIGGAQAGYNWQVNNFVLGLETDIQASGQKGTDTFDGLIVNLFGNNAATGIDTSKLDWFGTTRARLGLAVDRWLVYGTGGVAYGEVNHSGSIQPASPSGFPPGIVQNAPIAWDQSIQKVGWAAGAGVENAFTANWSWKLEYLYMDLGTATANVSGGVGNVIGISANCYGAHGVCAIFPNSALGSATSHFTDNILRVGVNYRFN
jgi:outer membrane immunogenic protein